MSARRRKRTGPRQKMLRDACTPAGTPHPDPLGQDGPNDTRLILTDRKMVRVVTLAVETTLRLARDGRDSDPVGWMYAPLSLFAGARPVEGCTSRQGFAVAMALHGLWPELDADPDAIAGLFSDQHDGGH